MKKIFLIAAISVSNFVYPCECIRGYIEEKLGETVLEMFKHKEYFEREFANDNDRYWYLAGRAEAFMEIHKELTPLPEINMH